MSTRMKLILLAAALAASTTTEAATRAALCSGCSDWAMQRKAELAQDDGIVYVFDGVGERVHKYSIMTDDFDGRRGVNSTVRLAVERDIEDAYRAYLRGYGEGEDFGAVILPDDFPIRTVAGALLDPTFTNTHIRDYIGRMNLLQQLDTSLGILVEKLLNVKVLGTDISSLIQNVVFHVQFPDGSTQLYSIDFRIDRLTGEVSFVVTAEGEPRLANGDPAPTSVVSMNGFKMTGTYANLVEWMAYARFLGGRVEGSGSRMVCVLDGPVLRCTLY